MAFLVAVGATHVGGGWNGGDFPPFCKQFFAHFIKGMCIFIICILIICKQLTSLSMELSSVAYEAYRALVQAQSPTWLVDEAGSVHDGDLRTAQHFAGSI